jgi:uncharacterized protein YecT (DUF1311 family)
MKTLALAFLLVCALGTNPVNAAENSIDIQLEIDMHNAKTNSDMIRAHLKALKKWDADMNRTYKELKRLMTPNAWKDLVKAQKAWIAYRDAQIRSLDSVYPPGSGTMWLPIKAAEAMEITKTRALYLGELLMVVQEQLNY